MKNYLLSIFALIFISGCSSLSLSTDYDNKIDFSNFKTYRWRQENEHNKASVVYFDHIMDQRIRSTIDAQLQSQNYQLATDAEPVDFLINYSIVIEDRADIRTYNNYNGMYPGYTYRAGYGPYGRGVGFGYSSGSDTKITHYKQGTLIIDMINPETDKLTWRGAADGRLPKGTDRKERDELTQTYVSKILSDFPPKK